MISVVVTAHDRKKFLMDAVNSVLNQTLPREEYEVIVVKNFTDYDGYLEKNGIRSIYTDKKPTGEKIAIGIEESKGDVICFLDDDDMFTKDKLENVKSEFNNNDLVFYNNSKIFIDEDGNEIKKEDSTRIELSNRKNVRKFLAKLSYNLSSECIRKEAVDLEKLRYIGYSIDVVMPYFALNYGGKLIKDSKRLTFFRTHSGNFFAYSGKIQLNEFIDKNAKSYEFGVVISERIKDVFKGTYAEKLALAEYLSDLFYYTVYSSTSFNNRIKSVKIALSYFMNTRDQSGVKLVVASLLFLVSPKRLYSTLYNRYLKKVS
ncbi:glycosyltransferase family 2 protein [Stygiolobus caldivivus]|uniref:Glycosyltransferase 2-like domain-containing protein n=1 Tax=Stygiolobus caldivivus TaxID=2824673 RepID=A0A8D5U714_9CREN|nr:glycosyltransferase family 2 protein [Stygiolobus caldivivus]BCU70870.1 hypothetical protein KN1_21670 [Stygiolobus caldivivus]